MKPGIFFKLFLAVSITCCTYSICSEQARAADASPPQMTATQSPLELSAVSAKEQTVMLGAVYDTCVGANEPDKYKFQVELTSAGAAIKTVQLSEFSNLDRKNQKPLQILNPVAGNWGKMVYSLACESLYVVRKGEGFSNIAFPLDKLQWQLVEPLESNKAVFVAEMGILEDKDGKSQLGNPVLRITRTYAVQSGSYDLGSDIKIENLSTEPLNIQFQIAGPTGISHEGAQSDTLKVAAAYQNPKGEVVSRKIDTPSMKKAIEKNKTDDMKLNKSIEPTFPFLWAALANKYFAAILYPSAQASQTALTFETCRYYAKNPAVKYSENASFALKTARIELGPKDTPQASASLAMNLYIGPKSKEVFQDNPVYNKLSFFQTIDFSSCCCPQGLIGPLAFGIVWLINAMYHWMGPLGNYGVVIIILVCLMRLALHPITKSSQVHMMKTQKLMPKFQELQKKMGKDRTKLDPEMMAMQKEMMRAQVMGMLPMFLQMPIWIALWTAVSIDISLRGQGLFPFWITDLSSPDALISFTPFAIPLLGWEVSSFNLLPLVMGFVMYLQMKLTPTSQTAPASPEAAQQQKIMSVMMVGMFPIMLYNGPSGVNLYIMASMAAGVVEQYIIRKHLLEKQEQEEETLVPTTAKLGKTKKKKSKPLFKFNR
jgi:YidC/Oxa1 family membrane protein insertase